MKGEDSTAWLQGFIEIRGEQKRFRELSEEDIAWLAELYRRAKKYKNEGMGEKAALEAARKELEGEESE
jgi:hypothetical protein